MATETDVLLVALLVLLVAVLVSVIFLLLKRTSRLREKLEAARRRMERKAMEVENLARGKELEQRNLQARIDGYMERMEFMEERRASDLESLRSALMASRERELAALRLEKDRKIMALDSERERQLAALERQVRKDTSERARAVLKGKIGEQMAPLLEEFHSKYELSDARFLGEPVDYIIFRNLTRYKDELGRKVPQEKRTPIEVVLADIKTGRARLSSEQRSIRDAVLKKRVRWDEIRIRVPSGGPPEPPDMSLDDYMERPSAGAPEKTSTIPAAAPADTSSTDISPTRHLPGGPFG